MAIPRTFDTKKFAELFYDKQLSYKEISKILNVPTATLTDYRWRNNLPVRGWIKHPFLGKHHSEKSKNIISGKLTGMFAKEKNWNWKGGRYKGGQGYILIRVENHPFAYENYIREHRLVMEKKIGRYLNPTEHVHHINGDKTDNRIENLILFHSDSDHLKYHFPKGSKFGQNQKATL